MKKIILTILFVLTLYSCSINDFEPINTESRETDTNKTELENSDNVTQTEINNILASFNDSTDILHRSIINSIDNIRDADGNVAAYVVNFGYNQGFVIISATKRYCPVIAYSHSGTFEINGNMPDGLKEWESSVISAIEISKTLPDDSVMLYRRMWKKYENPMLPKSSLSRTSSDDLLTTAQAIMADSLMAWHQQGYSYREVDEEDLALVEGAIYPLFLDYDPQWKQYACVVEKTNTHIENIPNFLSTTWAQTNGYNMSFPILSDGKRASAGCGPVAAGQIMWYHRFPSFFNWDAMPSNFSSQITSDFLYAIAQNVNAEYKEDGTATKINDMGNLFRSWGYNVSLVYHTSSAAWSSLQDYNPVYMRGTSGKGHAWVASGGNYRMDDSRTLIYTFTSPTTFESVDEKSCSLSYIYYFYMNWGWGGSYNGYYLDDTLSNPQNSQLWTDRKDLIIKR